MKQTLAMLAAVFGIAAQAQMTPVGVWHTIDDETHQPKGEVRITDNNGVLSGVTVDDLKPQVRNQLNLPARLKGALITDVDPASAAAKSGLRPGDVILEINRQPVNSAREAVELSAKADGKKTLLRLFSRGTTLFVVVDETAKDSAQ